MGQKIPPGLIKRGDTYHIQKVICGHRVRQSTGTSSLQEAERFLAHVTESTRNRVIYGERPDRTFKEACVKFLKESTKASVYTDAIQVKLLVPFIGDLPISRIHMGVLQEFIKVRRSQGVKTRTINYGLQTVRRILNLAAGEWIDENGLTWLHAAPKIKLFSENDKREPYPLSWEEQEAMFLELPEYLRAMALFKVNTGCREAEVCNLKWDYEVDYPLLNTSVFVLPRHLVKNRRDRVIILNDIARAVIDAERGKHPDYVFSYEGRQVKRIYGRKWRQAREKAGLPDFRVHDLKHTFGRRLRAADVPEEDRKDLLGHKSGRSMTTHCSAAEISKLIGYSNRVCEGPRHKSDTIIFLEKKAAKLRAANG